MKWLCDDTKWLLRARNFLVYALVTGRAQDKGEYAAATYNAKLDIVEFITAAVVERHAQYIEEQAAHSAWPSMLSYPAN